MKVTSICSLALICLMLFITCNSSERPKRKPAPYGVLVLQQAVVYDNGEGDEDCSVTVPWPLSLVFGRVVNPCHGPHGSLHVLVFDAGYGCPPAQKGYNGYLRHIHIKGPTPKGEKWEWLDGDEKEFSDLALYEWRNEDDSVIIFVYESDPSAWMGISVPGRGHDPLFCMTVSRSDTRAARTLVDMTRLAERRALRNCRRRGIRVHNPSPSMSITLKTVEQAGAYDYLP
jgi:hypothetical protein